MGEERFRSDYAGKHAGSAWPSRRGSRRGPSQRCGRACPRKAVRDMRSSAGASPGQAAEDANKRTNQLHVAETRGFEPPVPVSQYNDLANRRLKPLGHVSVRRTRIGLDRPDFNPLSECRLPVPGPVSSRPVPSRPVPSRPVPSLNAHPARRHAPDPAHHDFGPKPRSARTASATLNASMAAGMPQ